MVTVRVDVTKEQNICIGRVGENDHTQVIFEKIVREWLAEYPGAVIGLYNRLSSQDQAYPVANIRRAGDTVIWTVKSSDLSEEGRGQCQLVAVQDSVIVKSAYWNTRVLPSLDGSATPPAPWAEWEIKFIRLKGEAEAAAQDAEEAAGHYPKIENGVWMVWDAQGGAYVSTGIEAQGPQGETGAVFTPSVSEQGVISWENNGGLPNPVSKNIKGPAGAVYTPSVSEQGVISWTNDGGLPNPTERNIKGEKGDDGVSPGITVEAITGGHRITITDADHPQGQTVDVMDGSDGRGIVSVTKTSTSGLVDTYTITYTSGSPTTFTVTNGADGTDGTNAYVHIRYASAQPTQDSDMSTNPGPWMGVYSGSSATAPVHYTDYEWNDVQGPQGDQGLAFTFEDDGTGMIVNPNPSALVGIQTVNVSGSTPSITAEANHRYVCGEVSTLSITPPVSGIFEVIFTSGSTATVLSTTGITWPSWFDATSLDANTVYEINVQDSYALVATWEVSAP